MFRPRHIVTWGERLRQKRAQTYYIITKELSSEELCAHHLAHVGEIRPYNVEASTEFFFEELGENCFECPHKSSCELYLGEE